MMFLPQRRLLLSRQSSSGRIMLMWASDFLLPKPYNNGAAERAHRQWLNSYSSYSQAHVFHSDSRKSRMLCASIKPSPPVKQENAGHSYASSAAVPIPTPVSGVCFKNPEMKQLTYEINLTRLRQKLQEIGFDMDHCNPGKQNNLTCPKCRGGESQEKSLSLHIPDDWGKAAWKCFRSTCGWAGVTRMTKVKQPPREISEESLNLEPLCEQLVAYFSERMISKETLKRNGVMQKSQGDQLAIAFTYRRNGELVSCKYRDSKKKFWQEANTEKIFYGLDDVKDGSDIIIVEGEMDKLAMEEAGFKNCVSVPNGAPAKVSDKGIPPREEDRKYQYLWNCKNYTDKASRIILATDADPPGQALAEELTRRLGRERCWRVKWPNKNDKECFKDANEVLMFMGADALREVIEKAELYPIKGLFNFEHYFQEIDDYYHRSLGFELGVPTGWRVLNGLYNTSAEVGSMTKVKKPPREISEESLNLEPLCEQLVAYFSERMISIETLKRNGVMQKSKGDQLAIAFPYRRNGELVSCKYRGIKKRYWQEANTEKIFYGLDDVKDGSDIIIVEGEIDKLAMEEAGFKNCVSVPDGAPSKVKDKGIPPREVDRRFKYLWNCKNYTDKASRIILATDADPPGQALAEELARRLGRERCWRVKWPNKNDKECFNDANEVLMFMGADALKEIIEKADLYPIKGLFNFEDYFQEIDDYYQTNQE